MPQTATAPASPGYLSQEEVAAFFNVTVKTVRNWIADGTLPAVRVGPRIIRVRRDDLDAMIRDIPTAGARYGTAK